MIPIQFISEVAKFDSNLWGYHFIVPDKVAENFTGGKYRRVICKVNNQFEIRSALMGSPEGWFIFLNTGLIKTYRLDLGQKIDVTIEKDTSEYGMEMPEELSIMLDQDPEVNEYFHKLTPGKQRTLIYIVNKVKGIDSRINKALAICHHLREERGVLDFKKLNVVIKHYNQLGKPGN